MRKGPGKGRSHALLVVADLNGAKAMGVYLQIEEYHRPQDLSQAVEILSRFGKKAKIIAGGTDILPQRPGVKISDSISHLVDISNLDLMNFHSTPSSASGGIPIFSANNSPVKSFLLGIPCFIL